mmetsp:Transcript_1912/g.4326  ORF Transcript_1912/g.4326 Transcript_1912/m.4326 type:complete len:117 (-) Transcript_1912:194-544(-)
MPIAPEQFVVTLQNMTASWLSSPLPSNYEKSFFDPEELAVVCSEMIDRWHSGQSSHPDAATLAATYTNDEAGAAALQNDLLAIQFHPDVMANEEAWRKAKFSGPPEDPAAAEAPPA